MVITISSTSVAVAKVTVFVAFAFATEAILPELAVRVHIASLGAIVGTDVAGIRILV
jgi:hypothetical protein